MKIEFLYMSKDKKKKIEVKICVNDGSSTKVLFSIKVSKLIIRERNFGLKKKKIIANHFKVVLNFSPQIPIHQFFSCYDKF